MSDEVRREKVDGPTPAEHVAIAIGSGARRARSQAHLTSAERVYARRRLARVGRARARARRQTQREIVRARAAQVARQRALAQAAVHRTQRAGTFLFIFQMHIVIIMLLLFFFKTKKKRREECVLGAYSVETRLRVVVAVGAVGLGGVGGVVGVGDGQRALEPEHVMLPE